MNTITTKDGAQLFYMAAMLSSKLVKGATLKVYPDAPHGLTSTHKDQVGADLLAFLERAN